MVYSEIKYQKQETGTLKKIKMLSGKKCVASLEEQQSDAWRVKMMQFAI